MGMFNTVTTPQPQICMNCHQSSRRRIQFKYGSCMLYEYEVGDSLSWGAHDEGEPGMARVAAEGIPESCPFCGYLSGTNDGDFDVMIEHDVIVSVDPTRWEFDYPPEGWLILER